MSVCTCYRALALVLGELLLVATAGQSYPSAARTSVEVHSGCPAQGECASSLLQLGQLRERQVVKAFDSTADSAADSGWFGGDDDDDSKESDGKEDSKNKSGKPAAEFDEDAGLKGAGEKKDGGGDGDGDKKGNDDKKDGDGDSEKKDGDGDGDDKKKDDKQKDGKKKGRKKKDGKKKATKGWRTEDDDGDKKGDADGDEEKKTSSDQKNASQHETSTDKKNASHNNTSTSKENKTLPDSFTNSSNKASSNPSAAKKDDTEGATDNKDCAGWKTYALPVGKKCPKSDLVANVNQCEAVLKLLKYDFKFAGSTSSGEKPAGCFYVDSLEYGRFNRKSGTVPDDSEDGVHALCARCLTAGSDDEAADLLQSVPAEDRSTDGDEETTPF